MRLVLLDLETFFDSKGGYTLRKMSTEEYCRDPRFAIHLCGYWSPSTMPQGPVTLEPGMLESNQSLRRTINTSAVMAFHASFDLLALSHWYGLRPAFIIDPLCMARLVLPKLKSHSLEALAHHFGLGTKTVPYSEFDGLRTLPPDLARRLGEGCQQDIRLMGQIFDRLAPHVPKAEMKVISATVKMFTQPVLRLDRPRMEKFLKAEKIRKAKAMLAAGEAMGYPPWTDMHDPVGLKAALALIEIELQSSAKFRTALEAIGVECPMKTSPTTGEEIPAIAKSDSEMKLLLEHDDPRVQALAAARLGVKATLNETRAQRFLDNDNRGPLAVYLKYAGQKTIRTSGGDGDNWKNLPRGGEIRKSIRAPEGYRLVIGDLSQIEYRLLCWLAGETEKLAALAAGIDLYSATASEFYGRPIDKSLPKERGLGKQITLSCGYGSGADSIQRTAKNGTYGPPVELTSVEALAARDLYRATHPAVVRFWDWCGKRALPALAKGAEEEYSILVPPDGGDEPPILRIASHKIYLPNGTSLNYEGLRWARLSEVYPGQEDGEGPSWWEVGRKGYTRTWGSHLTADIVQALARVVLMDILVRMLDRGYSPCLEIYDELVYCLPAVDAEWARQELEAQMTTPPAWLTGCPLACEILVSEAYDK